MLINPWEMANIEAKCVWLCGLNANSEAIWQNLPGQFIIDLIIVESYSFFESSIYKTIFSKENNSFLKNSVRQNWNSQLWVKGLDLKTAQSIAHESDAIVNFEKIPDSKKMKFFKQEAKNNKWEFDEEDWEILYNAADLREIITCNLLKTTGIDRKNWHEFMEKGPISWAQSFKKGSLIKEGIIEDNVVPALKYFIKAADPERKAIGEFLDSIIRNGAKLWEYKKIWQNIAK